MYDEEDLKQEATAKEMSAQYCARKLARRKEMAEKMTASEILKATLDCESALEFYFADVVFSTLIVDWKGRPDQLAKKCWGIARAMISERYKSEIQS